MYNKLLIECIGCALYIHNLCVANHTFCTRLTCEMAFILTFFCPQFCHLNAHCGVVCRVQLSAADSGGHWKCNV